MFCAGFSGSLPQPQCIALLCRQLHAPQALGEHEYFLHPYLDSLRSLLSPHTSAHDIVSRLSLSSHVGEHIDTGLFNIVLGEPQDLAALKLRLGPGAPLALLLDY